MVVHRYADVMTKFNLNTKNEKEFAAMAVVAYVFYSNCPTYYLKREQYGLKCPFKLSSSNSLLFLRETSSITYSLHSSLQEYRSAKCQVRGLSDRLSTMRKDYFIVPVCISTFYASMWSAQLLLRTAFFYKTDCHPLFQ